MSTEKVFEFTKKGLEDAKEKLEILKTVTRKEVSEKIKEARSFGDLSENAEYDEAKNEQAEVEAEIMKLEEMIKYAKIVDNDTVSDAVTPGSTVTIFDIEENEELVYTIVGTMEADLASGKISYESPVGAALLNKKVGDEITDPIALRILKIEK